MKPPDSPIQEKTRTAERLVRHSLWLFLAEALAKVLGLAIQVIAARYLGDQGFGTFSFAFAGSGAFIVFIDIGLAVYLTREVARYPHRAADYLQNVFAMKWVFSLVSVTLLGAGLGLASLDWETCLVVLAIGLGLMVNGYTDMYLAVYRALERMDVVSVFTVLPRLLFFGLGFGVLLLGFHVVEFSVAFLAVSVIHLLIVRRDMHARYDLKRGQWDRDLVREIFRMSVPICGIILFAYVYFRVDAVILYFLRGEAETGWYSAAFKLIESLGLLIASVRGAVFPILSKTFEERRDQSTRILKAAIRYLWIVCLPLSVGMLYLAVPLVDLLYGSAFGASALVLQVMALTFPLLCLNDMASYFLVSHNRAGQVLKVVAWASVFNVSMNFLLVPRWGYTGSALAAVLTQGFLFAAYFRSVRKAYGPMEIPFQIWRPGLAAAGMGGVLLLADSLPWGVQAVLGAVSYLLFLMLLQTFDEFDFLVLRSLCNRKLPSRRSGSIELPPVSLDLSIVTVNFKSWDYLRNCLRSLRNHLKEVSHEVIVVDNHSGDGTVEGIRTEFPEVRLIVNTENVGFARATNQGIRISRGRRILLLNNDTVVLPGALETMMDLMDRNPALGLLGCRLLNPDYSVQQSFGRMVSFVNDFGRKFILNKLYRKYHNPLVRAYLDWLHSSPKEVDWVRGACMLARREALVDVGLMDENFFMYLEDIDLGVGMRQLGWEVCFTPAAAVIHYEGASSAKNLFRTALEYRKSQLYFYKKHYGRSGLFRLRVYLYGKLFKLRLQSQIQRWMSRTSPAAIEETEKLNREIFRIVRDYR